MPTLSIVRTDFKKVLKYGGIALGVILILFISFKILMFMKNVIFPPPPPVATAAYGKLPEIEFPQSVNKEFKYEIDTLTGDLPVLPDLANVYKMEERGPDILAVDKASNYASGLGFNRNPQQISDFVYKWTNPEPPKQILVQDIRLDEFSLTSSFLDYEIDLNEKFLTENEAKDRTRKFLAALNMDTEDIDDEKTKIEYQLLKNGVISPTSRFSNANLATIYYFQKNIDELPIVYPQANKSSMKMVVGAGAYRDWMLEANYSHQKILDESGTYSIKTAQQAFEDLQNKKAFIASHSGENTNIKIKNIYLAYYSEGNFQKYLTPVIVFEGDNNFIAYVPAVTDEWFEK